MAQPRPLDVAGPRKAANLRKKGEAMRQISGGCVRGRLGAACCAALLILATGQAGATTAQPEQAETQEEADTPTEGASEIEETATAAPAPPALTRNEVAAAARQELQKSGIGQSVDRLKTYSLILLGAVALLLLAVLALLAMVMKLARRSAGPPAATAAVEAPSGEGGSLIAAEEDLYGSKAIP